ncbi:hypothetical protein [Pseudochrobactrum sp. XF203]|uniref:hypothetical protein n=1 Tax=Pseudochrobactrum sp. XF203 TaxID=2879116 RepID=UPI001CE2EE01|nr:hypothetical protein [Pseudochrobactrum sp. XF203]UCA44770.1 hypothetical protein LDL70_10310 [Pseudochrobactrum sp. XF203]
MIDQEYTYEVSNIKVEDNHGLFAYFDVKQMNEDGDLIEEVSTGDWIDLDDGLLVNDHDASNLWHYNRNLDMDEVHAHVNDYLRENPISDETLEDARVAKAEREEEINKRFSM